MPSRALWCCPGWKMADLLPDPVAPDVIALDERFGPLSGLVTRLSSLPVEKLLVYLVDQVDARLLPELGRQFHVTGLEGWGLAATDEERRALVRRAIALHRKKGTPWAVREALKPVGVAVEIIEQLDQRRAYAALDPDLVNGDWCLDGAVRLRALDRQTYIPQVQHWAQFLVRMNLADVSEAGRLERIKALVNEWKPVSRHAVWQLWLALVARHHVSAQAGLHARLPSTRLHPWENLSLSGYSDASWRLGADGLVVRLPAPFGFALGRVHGAIPGARLAAGRVRHGVSARLAVAAGDVFRPEILAREPARETLPAPRLFWRRRRLDGAWRLEAARLGGGRRLGDPGFRLWGRRFFDCRRIDGAWRVAMASDVIQPARLRLTGFWRVGGDRCPEFSVRRVL